MKLMPLFAASLLFSSACSNTGESPAGNLDPNASPVVDGTWSRFTAAFTWQWQLTGTVNTGYDVQVYDIDMFESDASLIAELKSAGRKVVCYFSAGSSENWRPDFGRFTDSDMGQAMDGWDGERWLDIRSANVHAVMRSRLDLAVSKGCDGVEPDNMDGYANDSGFDLTASQQLAFNRFIANEAHARTLTVGLKNDGAQATDLVAYFDFSLNEQCHELGECSALAPFPDSNKPIFNAEYEDDVGAAQARATSLCPLAVADRTQTLILPLELNDAFRVSCD